MYVPLQVSIANVNNPHGYTVWPKKFVGQKCFAIFTVKLICEIYTTNDRTFAISITRLLTS